MTRLFCLFVVLCSGLSIATFAQAPATDGVLLMAHGGSPQWNERVTEVAQAVNRTMPTEVAFGMASRASLQIAVDRLKARGVTQIVAVPLFVSSHSSVITATEYLLGQRREAPADLKLFAKMDHPSHAPPAEGADHSAHLAVADPTSPVTTTISIRMTSALNRHPLIGQIAADRARSISNQAANEAVLLVAHGPVPEDDNNRWLEDMAVLAEAIKSSAPYAAVDYMTVRDDAGPALREAAAKDLRSRVEKQIAAGHRVLVVPHLMSFGGIEQGIKKRLEGLDYTMASQAIMPDARVVQWVLGSAAAAR